MSGTGRFVEAARVAAAALLGALLIVRLLWSGVTYPESDAFIALAALAILTALLTAVGCARGEWRLVAPADGGAILYLCVLFAVSLAAPCRWLARGVLIQAVACTAAYLVAANTARSRRARLALCAALTAGTLAVSLYGLYQHFHGFEETRAAFVSAGGNAGDRDSAFASRLYSNAIFSTFFYPNALAGFFVVAIPFAVSLLLTRRQEAVRAAAAGYLALLAAASAVWAFLPGLPGRPFLLAGLFVAAAALAAGLDVAERRVGGLLQAILIAPVAVLPAWALILTAAEGAWLALAAACVLGPLLFVGRCKTAGALLIALALLLSAVWCAGWIPDGLAGSFDVRMDYWRAAWAMWRAHPLAGMGPGTFAGAYPAFRLPGSEEGRMAHSAYLGLAAETGLAGLAAFLAMAGMWLAALRAGAARREPLAAAALVSVCAFLIHNAADVGFVVPGTTFTLWLLVGVGAGASAPPREWKRLPRVAGLGLAALVLAATVWLIVPRARAEARRLAADRLACAGRGREALAELEGALALEGDNPDYWLLRAKLRTREEGDARALDSYARAAALGERMPGYHFQHAICLWRLSGAGGDPFAAAEALNELREAIRRNPHDPDYHLLRGHWLEKTGQGEAALLEYRRGLKLIETARATPRIRRHGPAALERLEAAVIAKIEEMEREMAPRTTGGKR